MYEPPPRPLCGGSTQDGFLEARTSPLGPAEAADAVALANPLSAAEGYLRAHLLPGLVRRVEYNWSVRERDVRLFEVGTVFRSGAPPEERLALAGVLTGSRQLPGGDAPWGIRPNWTRS